MKKMNENNLNNDEKRIINNERMIPMNNIMVRNNEPSIQWNLNLGKWWKTMIIIMKIYKKVMLFI